MRKSILKLGMICTLVMSFSNAILNATVITRAAVDIGSKGLKVTVGDVDTSTQTIKKIHYSKEHSVPLKRDMQVSGQPRFSEAVQQLAINTLAGLQKELAHYRPVEWSGIATAASRESQNAQELYDKMREALGVNVAIISQEEEGRLGFNTAVAVGDLDRKSIISYDSGGGSFQLTTEIGSQLEVVQGKFAYVVALAELVTNIRQQQLDIGSSPNPVTVEEARMLVPLLQARLPQMSEAFAKKLKQENNSVIGIGNENFIFAFGSIATGKKTYTKEELWKAIEAHCNLTDQDLHKFAKPDESVVGMVLLYSVMDGFGIDELTFCYANGNCEGLLIDPTYWTITE